MLEMSKSQIPDFAHSFETDSKQQWQMDTQEPMVIRSSYTIPADTASRYRKGADIGPATVT